MCQEKASFFLVAFKKDEVLMKLTYDEFKKFISVMKQPCCYFGLERKSFSSRLLDNIIWYINEGRVNIDYNIYGCDLTDSLPNTFLSHRRRADDMKKLSSIFQYDELLKFLDDKYFFYLFCKENKLPHPKVFMHYKNGEETILDNADLKEILDKGRLFCKQTTGFGGHEVRCIKTLDELQSCKRAWYDKEYILQEGITNHHHIAKLYANSLNTIRCVTVSDGYNVSSFAAVLRIGTQASGNVDNVSSGGLCVGIEHDGTLLKYGNYDDYYKLKVLEHPDTKVIFNGFKIPSFKEAIDVALKAHSCIKEIPSIGWDIAITETTPLLIEANYDWGLQIMQMCHGGLKKDWERFIQAWK